jgi:hypothetical protein
VVRAGLLNSALMLTGCDSQQRDAGGQANYTRPKLDMPRVSADCTIVKPDLYADDFSPRAPVKPSVIYWESGAWGALDAVWMIERGGQGCFKDNTPLIEKTGAAPILSKFTMSDQEFDEIAATLNYDRLKGQLSNCVQEISDSVNGNYTWYGEHAPSMIQWDKGAKCADTASFFMVMEYVTTRIKAKIQ